MKFEFRWGTWRDAVFGFLCAMAGLSLVSIVMLVSHFNKRWFFYLFAFIFAMTLLLRFQRSWDKLWRKNGRKEIHHN